MSTKLAPNRSSDSDKTKISNENNCKHFKVGYCNFAVEGRHTCIKEECEVKDCNKMVLDVKELMIVNLNM